MEQWNGDQELLATEAFLAVTQDKKINKTLNDRLNRTEFMPFAPIILKEKANEYFEDFNSELKTIEFMTITLNVNKDKIKTIPAVVHVDNTARPQLVTESKNKSLYNILTEYQKLSGIPVLINTSFNLHEEPIVCTPNDALRAFEQGAVDFLALENFWVSKKSKP